jgi:hypothetical protein
VPIEENMESSKKLSSEFLDHLHTRADEHFKGRLHQAFIAWYVEAEFGDVKWDFTDDVHDSGIDAVVWHPEDSPPVTIIQSKFSENIGKGRLSKSTYNEFKSVIDAFRHGDERLEKLVADARSDLRRIYRKAHETLEIADNWFQKKKAFRLITSRLARRKYQVGDIPPDHFLHGDEILRLYSDFRQAQTPRARDLTLRIEDKLSYRQGPRGVASYLFSAQLSDFRRYLQTYDVPRLLARNIRYDLGSRVGEEIKKTYERAPDDFWYFHNGLTIICDDFVERNKEATLVAPSVVNGAQTLYAISTSKNKTSPALVPVKVIVRAQASYRAVEDDQWLQDIIRSVNSQNRVRNSDLRSNEPEQVLLQTKFRDLRVYYERKRGEWRVVRNEPRYRNHERLSLVRLGQILTATNASDGTGVLTVKKGVDDVFEKRNYKLLFPRRSVVARRFERIYLAYRIAAFLENFGYRNATERRKLRHGFWSTLWLMHRGIVPAVQHSNVDTSSLKRAFDHLEAGSSARARVAKRTARHAVSTIWDVWRKAASRDRDLTPNNFFKSKSGIQYIRRLSSSTTATDLRSLGRFINSYK